MKIYENLPSVDEAKEIIHRLLGCKEIKRKTPIEVPPYSPKKYVWRSRSLGKSRNSTQGVAGWRTGYHRLDEVPLAPAVTTTLIYEDDRNDKGKPDVVPRKSVARGSGARKRKLTKRKSK